MEEGDFFFMDRKFVLHFIGRLFVLYFMVNFPVKNLELKDHIPLLTPKANEKLRSKYDLIANIVHDGKPGEGVYRVFVQRKSENYGMRCRICMCPKPSSDGCTL